MLFLQLAFPRLLHNDKITDNSPEAHPCLFLPPHVPQVLLFIMSCTQVLQNPLLRGSGRLAKSGIPRDVSAGWVGMCTGVFVWPGSAIILNPALVVLDKAHLALWAYPCSSQKWLLQNTLESGITLENLQQQKKTKKNNFHCHCTSLHLCVCVVCVVHLKENWGSALAFVGCNSGMCSMMQTGVKRRASANYSWYLF